MVLAHAGHLIEQGCDVEIWAAQIDTVFPLPDGLKLYELKGKSKLATLWNAFWTYFNADYVVADIIPLICLLAARNRCRLIYFAQDYDESYYQFAVQRFFIRGLYLFGLSFLGIKSIAVSQQLTDLLRLRFNANVSTAENGVDTDIFFHDPDPDLVALKETRRAIVVLSREDTRKGFDIAQKVLLRLADKLTGRLEVWSVGEKALGAFPSLTHRDFGYVDESRLRLILSSADVFLYPSRHEGFPLMALESLACGCPLVTTEAVPLVEDGVEALVSRVEDVDDLLLSLVRIFEQQNLSGELRNAGYRFIAEHTLQKSKRTFAARLMAGDKLQ